MEDAMRSVSGLRAQSTGTRGASAAPAHVPLHPQPRVLPGVRATRCSVTRSGSLHPAERTQSRSTPRSPHVIATFQELLA